MREEATREEEKRGNEGGRERWTESKEGRPVRKEGIGLGGGK